MCAERSSDVKKVCLRCDTSGSADAAVYRPFWLGVDDQTSVLDQHVTSRLFAVESQRYELYTAVQSQSLALRRPPVPVDQRAKDSTYANLRPVSAIKLVKRC